MPSSVPTSQAQQRSAAQAQQRRNLTQAQARARAVSAVAASVNRPAKCSSCAARRAAGR